MVQFPTVVMILSEIICNTIVTSKELYFPPAYCVHLYMAVKGLTKSGFLTNACSKAHLLRGKKLSTPVSFLASSIALFRANNAAQLIHIGGSPTAETV